MSESRYPGLDADVVASTLLSLMGVLHNQEITEVTPGRLAATTGIPKRTVRATIGKLSHYGLARRVTIDHYELTEEALQLLADNQPTCAVCDNPIVPGRDLAVAYAETGLAHDRCAPEEET